MMGTNNKSSSFTIDTTHGSFTSSAVIESFSEEVFDSEKQILSIASFFERITGSSIIKHISQMLSQFNIKHEITHGKNNTIGQIKSHIDFGFPVILLVSNLFSPHDQTLEPRALSKFKKSHWISVWGYHPKKEQFIIYDPAVPLSHSLKSLYGNCTRHFETTTIAWYGTLPFAPYRNLMIRTYP